MPILHVEKQTSDGKDTYEVVETQALPVWEANTDFAVVGRPHARVEGTEKVTGRARYTYDIRLPGQLYARVLRSPHPHARIKHIDTTDAEAVPGVRAVLSSANAPDMEWYKDSKLFDTTVRFVGDEVAVVAADSEEIADDALRLITVEYELLPFAVTTDDALKPGAYPINKKGNTDEPTTYERGDSAKGLREADIVIDQVYVTEAAIHHSFEPHGTTAMWEGDRLTLWTSTQGLWAVREEIAEKLKLPAHRVRVITQYMGGGFGSKQVPWKQDALAALLAKRTGRPVQLMLDRRAEALAVGNRNATHQHVRIGARRDGTLTAIDVTIQQQIGAYSVGGEASNVGGMYQSLYRCDNVRTEATPVFTNTGPAVAFRAPGFVEAAFALESAMDELSRTLDIDPIELRRRNYTTEDQKDDKPYTSPEALRQCYDKVAETFSWNDKPQEQASGTKRRGIGFAAHDWMAGAANPPGYATITLNNDGTADVVTGSQDIGTGTRVGLTQVAAEELTLPIDSVALYLGDTSTGGYSPASAGSATLATIAPAIRTAAIEVKRQLVEAASPMLEAEPEQLVVRDGKIVVERNPQQSITIAEVMQNIAPHMIQAQGACGPKPDKKAVRTFGAQCVEVEVDSATGEVTVLRIVASHDCGRIINPTTVNSQIIGGITQGIGFGMTEERIVDVNSGIVLNANLEEYKIPTVADIPAITFAPTDIPDTEANPTGAKGVGEPPLVPTAPAIANAIFDAIGVRIYHAPLNRQRIVEALTQQSTATEAKGARA